MRALRFSGGWIAVGWFLVAGLVTVSLVSLPVELKEVDHGDKVAHLLAYLLLMAWFAQIWISRRALAAHAGFLILLGVALELLQTLNPHRTADVFDAVANTVGVLLGCLTARAPGSGLLERLEARL